MPWRSCRGRVLRPGLDVRPILQKRGRPVTCRGLSDPSKPGQPPVRTLHLGGGRRSAATASSAACRKFGRRCCSALDGACNQFDILACKAEVHGIDPCAGRSGRVRRPQGAVAKRAGLPRLAAYLLMSSTHPGVMRLLMEFMKHNYPIAKALEAFEQRTDPEFVFLCCANFPSGSMRTSRRISSSSIRVDWITRRLLPLDGRSVQPARVTRGVRPGDGPAHDEKIAIHKWILLHGSVQGRLAAGEDFGIGRAGLRPRHPLRQPRFRRGRRSGLGHKPIAHPGRSRSAAALDRAARQPTGGGA